jgi:hypothetical protein
MLSPPSAFLGAAQERLPSFPLSSFLEVPSSRSLLAGYSPLSLWMCLSWLPQSSQPAAQPQPLLPAAQQPLIPAGTWLTFLALPFPSEAEFRTVFFQAMWVGSAIPLHRSAVAFEQVFLRVEHS